MTSGSAADGSAFRPGRLIEVLNRHDVQFVVIGGYAAQLHGASRPTTDMDIAPATSRVNLDRLADALRELGAGIRVDEIPEGLPFDCSGESLRGMSMLNLRTPDGDLDLTFAPAAFPSGYEELRKRAHVANVEGQRISVAALDDVIESKRSAARVKDVEALPELLEIQSARRSSEEQRRQRDQSIGRDEGLER